MNKTIEKKQTVNFEQQLTFSVKQISQITSLSIAFLRTEISEGNLQHFRRRSRVLVTKEALSLYLSAGEQLAG